MRLIDADELLDDLIFPTEQFKKGFTEMINDAPTIEPVKHGIWLYNKSWGTECSECGYAMFELVGVRYTTCRPKYCPYCGAKMDGRRER